MDVHLFDDKKVTDKEIFGEKLLFMDENPPPLNTCEGIIHSSIGMKLLQISFGFFILHYK